MWLAVNGAVACGTPSTSPSPSVGAPPPASPEAIVSDAPLQAGWHTPREFDVPLAIYIGAEGWRGAHLFGEFADVIHGTPPDHITVSVGRPEHFFASVLEELPAGNPDEALAVLRRNSQLTVADGEATTIAGLVGRWADVRLAEGVSTQGIYGGSEGDLAIQSGRVLRLAVLDHGGELLVVGIEAPVGGLDEAVALGQPLVDSLALLAEQP